VSGPRAQGAQPARVAGGRWRWGMPCGRSATLRRRQAGSGREKPKLTAPRSPWLL